MIPLGLAPLLFYDDPNVDIDGSPFDILPWSNPQFRRLCGLKPRRPQHPAADNDDDDDNLDDDDDKTRFATANDGFTLTEAAYGHVPERHKPAFDPANHSRIVHFLEDIRTHAQQQRQRDEAARVAAEAAAAAEAAEAAAAAAAAEASEASEASEATQATQRRQPKSKPKPKTKTKAKAKKTRRQPSDNPDEGIHNCISHAKGAVDKKLYSDAIFGMFNLPGGVMSTIASIMANCLRSPADMWRDAIQDAVTDLDVFQTPVPPPGNIIYGEVAHAVGIALFGHEVLRRATRTLNAPYRGFVICLMQRCWERERRDTEATIKKMVTTNADLRRSIQDARDDPTPLNLRRANRLLMKYKLLTKLAGDMSVGMWKELDETVTKLWRELGFERGDDGCVVRTKAKKVPRHATDEEMYGAYVDYCTLHFPEHDDAIDEITHAMTNSLRAAPGDDIALFDGMANTDLGVQEFADASTDELFRLLGLSKVKRIPYMSEEMDIKWHQLVGIAVMIKRMFSTALGVEAEPTLLCDEVGLGKTVEIIGTIAMLVHLIELQEREQPLPPLLSESGRLYFAGLEKIPRLPSVIIGPRTLNAQWVSQLKRFTSAAGFRIVEYNKDTHDRLSFFADDGVFAKEVMDAPNPQRVILLVPTSTIMLESIACLEQPTKGVAGRYERFGGAAPTIMPHQSPDLTIFSKSFNVMACDELHQLRNTNSTQAGVMKISSQSMVRIGATATPIFTGVKDLAAQGRLLRVPSMIGERGYQLCMEMMRLERLRGREWREQSEDIMRQIVGDSDRQERHSQDSAASQYILQGDMKGYRNYYVQQESIDMMRGLLLPYIIRRTGESRTPDGKLVLDLKPYIESVMWTCPKPEELEAIKGLQDRLMAEKEDSTNEETPLVWRNFLLDYKHLLFHWLLKPTSSDADADSEEEDTEKAQEKFWEKWNKDNLNGLASSKVLKTLDLIEHYKDPDARPLFFNREDGSIDTQKECAVEPNTTGKRRKVLVFIVYDLHRRIMKKALSIRGHKFIEYDGNMSMSARDKAVDEFEKSDDIHVMLLSNVGTTGLNLTMASVVVFLSGLWSGMEVKQMIGRLWRHGQLMIVHVYFVLIRDTVDEILSAIANGKLLMLDHFTRLKKMAIQLLDPSSRSSNIDEESEVQPRACARRSRVAPRALKQQELTDDARVSDTDEAAPGPSGQPKANASIEQTKVTKVATAPKAKKKSTADSPETSARGQKSSIDEANAPRGTTVDTTSATPAGDNWAPPPSRSAEGIAVSVAKARPRMRVATEVLQVTPVTPPGALVAQPADTLPSTPEGRPTTTIGTTATSSALVHGISGTVTTPTTSATTAAQPIPVRSPSSIMPVDEPPQANEPAHPDTQFDTNAAPRRAVPSTPPRPETSNIVRAAGNPQLVRATNTSSGAEPSLSVDASRPVSEKVLGKRKGVVNEDTPTDERTPVRPKGEPAPRTQTEEAALGAWVCANIDTSIWSDFMPDGEHAQPKSATAGHRRTPSPPEAVTHSTATPATSQNVWRSTTTVRATAKPFPMLKRSANGVQGASSGSSTGSGTSRQHVPAPVPRPAGTVVRPQGQFKVKKRHAEKAAINRSRMLVMEETDRQSQTGALTLSSPPVAPRHGRIISSSPSPPPTPGRDPYVRQ